MVSLEEGGRCHQRMRAKMEQFNSKLYDKYQNLKKRKLFDEEEWSKKVDTATKSYHLEVEDLIEELKGENDRLRAEMIALQVKYDESQKQVLEKSLKTNELSNEIGKRQNLISEKNDSPNSESPRSPYTSPRARSRNTPKGSSKKTLNSCAVQNEVHYKEAINIPCESHQQEQLVPDCCRNNITSSRNAMSKDQLTCTFQTFVEFLVNLKFSLELQDEGLRILAIHQRSGYTFTLTWVRNEDGGGGEMWYRVSTLGTLERVALDWMKEDMIFSMTMFSLFFERIKRVLGRC